VIQVLLGHKKLETTSIYTQVATDLLREVISPLETLPSPRRPPPWGGPSLEVADIFRAHGPAWRLAQRGHLSLGSAQGHVGHRTVPQRGAGWARAALRGLRRRPDRLQLLPQPALPEVPERGQPSAGSRPARPICCRSSITTWSSRCRRRSQTSRMQNKAVIYRLLFEVAAETLLHHRRRSQAPGRDDRRHARAAHLGLGADAPPARARHRSRRRAGARRQDAGSPAGRASSCRCACSRGCSGGASWKNCSGRIRPASCGSSASTPALADAGRSRRWLAPLRKSEWVVYAKRPFAGPRRCWPTCRATPIGWPSPTAAGGDGRAGRDVPLEGLPGQGAARRHKTMTLDPRSSCAASCCMCCPAASTASGTTGLLANGSRKVNLALARELLHA
jgi:hypothetical protein